VTVNEARRRALHDQLVDTLGAEVADTLMDYLPPAGWSDLARRADLDALESRIDAKFADLRSDLYEKMASQTRWFMGSQLVLVAATIGSITAIAH
jgi:hypothetical protein